MVVNLCENRHPEELKTHEAECARNQVEWARKFASLKASFVCAAL